MKKFLSVLFVIALATTAFAQSGPRTESSDTAIDTASAAIQPANPNVRPYYMNNYVNPDVAQSRRTSGSNLTYHTGGVVIRNAHIAFIFWGPSFGSGGSDNGYATTLQGFRNQFGTTGEYNVITQYYGQDPSSGYGNIAQSNLAGGAADYFDGTTPPANVTDAIVQSEVQKVIAAQGSTDYNAIYEVVLPASSFSSNGNQGSCGATGGISLAYCAYHSHYVDGSGQNVKYSIEPYASCSGCQVSGWSDAQNQEHFIGHETREAVTDALGNAWYDSRGSEADDKCAWSPTPFLAGAYGYQYEWSNANSGCIQSN